MTKTYADPIVQANTALSIATQALTDAFTQRDRLAARLRLAELDVTHEERNAGLAVDRVLVGEAPDAKREASMLADARAAVDAVRQGGKRIEQQIRDAQAAVAQAERDVVFATADAAVQQSLAALPALEDAVRALGAAFHAVADPIGVARYTVATLHPGQAYMLPELPLVRYLGASLMRERIDINGFENTSITDATFELGVPVRAVTANMLGLIDRFREKFDADAKAAA